MENLDDAQVHQSDTGHTQSAASLEPQTQVTEDPKRRFRPWRRRLNRRAGEWEEPAARHYTAYDVCIEEQHKQEAAFTLASALGHQEAREALHRLGHREGVHLIPLNLCGLERHLPPDALARAAFELSQARSEDRDTIKTAWRIAAEAHVNPGGGSVVQSLGGTTSAATSVDPPHGRQTGRTVAAYLPPSVPDRVVAELLTQIADLVHSTGAGQPYDIQLVTLEGDPFQVRTAPQMAPESGAGDIPNRIGPSPRKPAT